MSIVNRGIDSECRSYSSQNRFARLKTVPASISCLFFIFLACLLLIGCKQQQAPFPKTNIKKISVVIDNNYPPYSFLDEHGNLQGISIDQWRLWEQKTGIAVEITGMNWSSAMASMEAGQFDVIDTIFYNESRAKSYDFTKPYATIDVPIYFENDISGITDAETAQGFIVAVKSGDAVIDILRSKGVDNLVLYESYESIIEAAVDHKVVVFAIDKPPADYFLYHYNIQDDFNSTEPLYSGQFHRAVKKGNSGLLGIIQAGFDTISESEYQSIDRKWFGTPALTPSILRYSGYIIGGAIFVLFLLGIWNRSLQVNVKKQTKTLQESESRYRTIFEESPVSLWVEDFSEAIKFLERTMKQVDSDLLPYLCSHPEIVNQCYQLIKVIDVNNATLDLYHAKNKTEMLGKLADITANNSQDILIDQLEALYARESTHSWEGINNTIDGTPLTVNLHWEVEPGYEKDMSRVILSVSDITAIRNVEHARDIVAEAQKQILHANELESIYNVVGQKVQELTGGAFVAVSVWHDQTQSAEIAGIYSSPNFLEKLIKKFRFEPTKIKFNTEKASEEDLRLFRSGKLETYPYGLRKLSMSEFPAIVCDAIESKLNYSKLYVMGFISEGKHLGGVSIVSKRDLAPIKGNIETIVGQATVAIKRFLFAKELQESEEKFRSLFDQSPMGIALSDKEFGFTAVNPAFCRMMGYAQDELLQKSFKDLTHPDDISASSKLMKQLRSGEIPTFTTEKRYIRKDKSIMWGSVSVKGIQDNSGQTVSFLAMLEDISARKNSEAELAKERQRIQVLMDTIPDSVYFKDVNSRFTSVNRATALKFGSKDPVELIGKSDHDYFNEYAAIQADKDEEKIVRSGDPIIGLEEQEIWPDKPPRWVSTTKMALKDENGNITGTFGVIRDITERKQQEEEIKRLNADLEKKVEQRTKELRLKNQELESFTYTVSHDLKAPLRGISGYADLLLQDHAGQLDEEGKSFLQKLIKSSIQLSQLIEDLLVYSRLERRPVTLENLKVNEIIDLVLEQRGQEIKNRNVAMHIDVVDETIKSSHELVTQIIMNYVDNALKFTSQCEVPEIWVNYANLGKTSLLSIKDNGVGFDAKYKDKIFEVFQRLQTTDVYPGTGIGLALVKKAAELLGYKVWAESEPGKGATFYLEIAK